MKNWDDLIGKKVEVRFFNQSNEASFESGEFKGIVDGFVIIQDNYGNKLRIFPKEKIIKIEIKLE